MFEDLICHSICPNNAPFAVYVSSVLLRLDLSVQTILVSLYYACTTFSKMPVFVCPYRLWIASLIVADTYLNDNSYECITWSEVSGLATKECVWIKTMLLQVLDWNMEVSSAQYSSWLEKIYNLQKFLLIIPAPLQLDAFSIQCLV